MDRIIDFVSSMESIKTHTISLVRGNLADMAFMNVDMLSTGTLLNDSNRNLRKEVRQRHTGSEGRAIKAAQDVIQREYLPRPLTSRSALSLLRRFSEPVLTENGEVYLRNSQKSFGNIRDYGYSMPKTSRVRQG